MPSQACLSAVPEAPRDRAREARAELLARITNFISKHDLNVTSANLATIGAALSGANATLAEAFAAREISGEPIDQRWLDTMMRLDPETSERMSELEKLMDRLEGSLMRFAMTAKSAQDQTSEHRDAIDAQIEAMAQQRSDDAVTEDTSGVNVDRVIELSKTMLDRLELVEQAMERSQAETQELRNALNQARSEADVDHLTRLPNRRAFERRLSSAAREAQAKGEPLCVAFCDVDNFKAINDTHGHDAGDRVLISIAEVLKNAANDECFVARHGGEEFVLLLFGLDKEAAWHKLDGIRRMQGTKRLIDRRTGKPFGKVTFSAGIAQVENLADSRMALARADAALYQAKQSGRDRIVAG